MKLTEERLAGIAGDMKNVILATVASWEAVSENNTPERHGDPQNDRSLRRDRCHLRTPECHLRRFLPLFQSGNACVLKGGSGCHDFQPCLSGDYPRRTDKTRRRSGCLYTPATRPRGDGRAVERKSAWVDLIIPRGSSSLINYVRGHASRVPVIETGAGICHTPILTDGDKEKGRGIVNNAKTHRVSICNALDCLIVHRDRLGDLDKHCGKLSGSNVIRC